MRTALLSGLAAMFFLFSAGEPEAAVWTVDPGGGGDFTTIQACLDAAVTGDSCEVSAGTYLENVDFQGKDTTLTSLDGPATTIIDGNGAGPVVTFAGGETGAAVLEGFTVQHGSGTPSVEGGGIYCLNSSPTILDCVITENMVMDPLYLPYMSGGMGGGICSRGGSPAIIGCTVTGNMAGLGGGIYTDGAGTLTVEGCTVTANQTILVGMFHGFYFQVDGIGGGVYCAGAANIQDTSVTQNTAIGGGGICATGSGALTVEGCLLSENTPDIGYGPIQMAPVVGGGIYCEAPVSISGSTISRNLSGYGGGICLSFGDSALITDTVIEDNDAAAGGGVFSSIPALVMTNSIVAGNWSVDQALDLGDGGGLYLSGGAPILTNCTISGNRSYYTGGYDGFPGGGILCTEGASPTLTNGILWGDDALDGPEIALTGSSSITVAYSDVQGGQAAVSVEAGSTLSWGSGNMDLDPQFAAPGYWDDNGTPTDTYDDVWVPGDFHITVASPVLDAGDNAAPEIPLTDVDGEIRIYDGDCDHTVVVDMGADEVTGGCSWGYASTVASDSDGNPSGSLNVLASLFLPVGLLLLRRMYARNV